MSDNGYSMIARCAKCKISAEQLMFSTAKKMPDCTHYWVEPQHLPLPQSKVVNISSAMPK